MKFIITSFFILLQTITIEASPLSGNSATYTENRDFDFGSLINIVHEPSDQLNWPIRLRTGKCPEGMHASEIFHIFIEGVGIDEQIEQTEIAVSVEIIELPWLECWWKFLAIALGILIIGILIHGFLSPYRFSSRFGVVLSPEEDITEGFFHPNRAVRGRKIGFYRAAIIYICADYRLSNKSTGAIARLRADGNRVLIMPIRGNTLYKQNVDGEWEILADEETPARTNTLYKDNLGTLFFEIGNG